MMATKLSVLDFSFGYYTSHMLFHNVCEKWSNLLCLCVLKGLFMTGVGTKRTVITNLILALHY